MSDISITKLSGLDIDPKDTSEKKRTGLYIPSLTTDEINDLSSDIVRDGGIIYDSTISGLRTRKNNTWIGLYGYRTGSVTVGDIVAPADPALTVTGSILSASKAASANNGNVVTINYADLGYIPFLFISCKEPNMVDSAIYEPFITSVNNTTAEIFFREAPGGSSQNLIANILLMQSDV